MPYWTVRTDPISGERRTFYMPFCAICGKLIPCRADETNVFPSAMTLIVTDEDHPVTIPPIEVTCFNGLDNCLKRHMKEQWDYTLDDYSLGSLQQAEDRLGLEIIFPPFTEEIFARVSYAVSIRNERNVVLHHLSRFSSPSFADEYARQRPPEDDDDLQNAIFDLDGVSFDGRTLTFKA